MKAATVRVITGFPGPHTIPRGRRALGVWGRSVCERHNPAQEAGRSRGTAGGTHAPGACGPSLSATLRVNTMDIANRHTRRTVKCLKATATTQWGGKQGKRVSPWPLELARRRSGHLSQPRSHHSTHGPIPLQRGKIKHTVIIDLSHGSYGIPFDMSLPGPYTAKHRQNNECTGSRRGELQAQR